MGLSNLKSKFMTRNDCYTAGRKITPKGIMVHSTATPGVMAADWFSRWNKSYKAGEINRQVCVHAFLDDKEVWQYLPWITEDGMPEEMRITPTSVLKFASRVGFLILVAPPWLVTM